ncbi:MAG: bifunctional DNA-formamidopyrimidine glycosylase/DNA-(apurinic or apyrimidinic site) lyase [Acidobacteriaceae bacterium]
MPELPEVETIAAGVHARVHGARITRVWTSGKPQTFKSPESEIAAALTGATIDSVRRVGKTIVMTLQRDKSSTELLIHLGMTGRLLVSQPEIPLAPHTHAVLTLAGHRELRFVDPRRFGRISLHGSGAPCGVPDERSSLAGVAGCPIHAASSHEWDSTAAISTTPTPYTGPGHEPLTITLTDFITLFHPRRTPIKAALLNQSLLHGIGNIYADESLFRASIRPTRQAARLTRAELARLRTALVKVLRHAIRLGGSSVSDYVDAEGSRGFFQLRHRVYQRTGQPCLVCATPIRRITLAGRSTHFCPVCQK